MDGERDCRNVARRRESKRTAKENEEDEAKPRATTVMEKIATGLNNFAAMVVKTMKNTVKASLNFVLVLSGQSASGGENTFPIGEEDHQQEQTSTEGLGQTAVIDSRSSVAAREAISFIKAKMTARKKKKKMPKTPKMEETEDANEDAEDERQPTVNKNEGAKHELVEKESDRRTQGSSHQVERSKAKGSEGTEQKICIGRGREQRMVAETGAGRKGSGRDTESEKNVGVKNSARHR